MRLMWTTTFPEDQPFREQWNALVFQMEPPEIFYTWEWAAAFARSYGESAKPWIVSAYQDDALLGVVAFTRNSATEVGFLTGTTADYCDFISTPSQRKDFVENVLRGLREAGIDRIVLANLPADSATVAALRASTLFKHFMRTGYICARVQLGTEEEKRSLSESMLKKKVMRRSLNALQRIGPVSHQHDRGSGLERGMVERFCRTHVARFLATGRISNLVRAPRRLFLRELAGLLAERGWFDFSTLRAGKFVVAQHFGFRFQGTWFWYQPTIVNKFEEQSPGYYLLAKVIQDACHDPEARLVDLGLGAEEYKERFANGERKTLYVTLARTGADVWKERVRYQAAERIKDIPRLEKLARAAQSMLREERGRAGAGGWPKTLYGMGRRVLASVAASEEILFFRWTESPRETPFDPSLTRITWETLADTAIRYSDDPEAMQYLPRSAEHLRSLTTRGYALTGADGATQHIAWVVPREEFKTADFGDTRSALSPGSVLIVDFWTPRELRGRGLYSLTIRKVAEMLSAEGKDVWISASAKNSAAVAGITKAGFQKYSSIFRRKSFRGARPRQEVVDRVPDQS